MVRPTNWKLNPDGVDIEVDWDSMVVGSSIFIPAINTTKLVSQARQKAGLRGWNLMYEVRIESGKWGVRFWRSM